VLAYALAYNYLTVVAENVAHDESVTVLSSRT